jgi:hypothetical protein
MLILYNILKIQFLSEFTVGHKPVHFRELILIPIKHDLDKFSSVRYGTHFGEYTLLIFGQVTGNFNFNFSTIFLGLCMSMLGKYLQTVLLHLLPDTFRHIIMNSLDYT